MKLALFGVPVALVALTADPADACSLFGNEAVTGDASPSDVTPPQVGVNGWDLEWHEAGGTCDAWGYLNIGVLGSDTQSPFGFVIEVASGNFPADTFPTEPQQPGVTAGELHYYFDYDVASIDSVLHVRAVDLAGNRSEPVAIELHGERPDEGGCNAGGGRGGVGGLVLAGLGLLYSLGAPRRRR